MAKKLIFQPMDEGPPPSSSETTFLSLSGLKVLAFGSIGLIVLAALLPWIEVQFIGTVSQTGLEQGYGIVTIILSILVATQLNINLAKEAVATEHDRRIAVGIGAAGALIVGVAGYAALEINARIGTLQYGIGHIGIGVWLTVLGGLGLVVTGLGFLGQIRR
jgi:hypothetical protein